MSERIALTRNIMIRATTLSLFALATIGAAAAGPPPLALPSAPPVMVPAPGQVLVPVPTVDQFAESFRPGEGTFHVVVIHPKTGCPVNVCFTLPCGCPRKVTATKYTLRFDYGRRDIVIRFRHDGTVSTRDS
jgi:hypothetical protein